MASCSQRAGRGGAAESSGGGAARRGGQGARRCEGDRMSSRRAAAIGALLAGLAGLVLAAVIAAQEFPRGLIVLACVSIASTAAWFGLIRRGAARAVGLAIAGAGFAAAIWLLLRE